MKLTHVVTRSEMEALATRAHETTQRVRRLRDAIGELWMQLAGELRAVRAERLYLALGYETFTDWLEDPQATGGISRRTAYRLLELAGAYLPEDGEGPVPVEVLAEIGLTKAALIRPVMTDPEATEEQRQEVIAQARTLSTRDLERELGARREPGDGIRERLASQWHALAYKLTETDDPRAVIAEMRASCDRAEASME